MGIKIGTRDASTDVNVDVVRKLQARLMHAMLGHPSNEHTKATCSRLGINLTGSFPVCDSCAHGKMKQKNTNKYSKDRATVKGERICFDISSVKKDSSGGAKFWLMAIDEATRHQWSYFLKTKKETKVRMLELIQELNNKHDIVIKILGVTTLAKTLILKLIWHNMGSTLISNSQQKARRSIMELWNAGLQQCMVGFGLSYITVDAQSS